MHALRYAIGIANRVEANVMLVHVMKTYREESIYPDESNMLRKEVKKRLADIIADYSAEMKSGKLMYKVRTGKVEREIVNQAKYHDAFLIIAGTHGISGFQPFWIGSNAYKIVAHSPCPIITIRYGESAQRTIKKIVVPIDSTKQTRQKIPFVSTLAKAYNAEILLLGLYSSNIDSVKTLINSYCKQVEEFLQKEMVKYTTKCVVAGNFTKETIAFAEENKADLIAIMSEQETTVNNILLGSYAQQMVNSSPVPVITIKAKHLYDHQLR